MSDNGQIDIKPHQEMWETFTQLLTGTVVVVLSALILMAIFLL